MGRKLNSGCLHPVSSQGGYQFPVNGGLLGLAWVDQLLGTLDKDSCHVATQSGGCVSTVNHNHAHCCCPVTGHTLLRQICSWYASRTIYPASGWGSQGLSKVSCFWLAQAGPLDEFSLDNPDSSFRARLLEQPCLL
jgi:hypothetical protein